MIYLFLWFEPYLPQIPLLEKGQLSLEFFLWGFFFTSCSVKYTKRAYGWLPFMGDNTGSTMELIKPPDVLGLVEQKPWERQTQITDLWGRSDQETCCETL